MNNDLDADVNKMTMNIKYILNKEYVVVQFCPWFKFYFSLSLRMIMYDDEFETKENKI